MFLETMVQCVGIRNPAYFVAALRYFGRMFLAGAMVEIAADDIWNWESRRPEYKNTVWAHYGHSEYEKIMWRGHGIYVESLQHRYQIEKARNRVDRVRVMEECM